MINKRLDIKDVHSIEVDLKTFTVKCLRENGFVLWETRKRTKEEALEVQSIINRKKIDYLESISKV